MVLVPGAVVDHWGRGYRQRDPGTLRPSTDPAGLGYRLASGGPWRLRPFGTRYCEPGTLSQAAVISWNSYRRWSATSSPCSATARWVG